MLPILVAPDDFQYITLGITPDKTELGFTYTLRGITVEVSYTGTIEVHLTSKNMVLHRTTKATVRELTNILYSVHKFYTK